MALLLVAGLGGACGLGAPREGVHEAGPWDTQVVFDAGAPLVGCGIGDVDPTRPGAEVVVAARDGRVFVVGKREGMWSGTEVHRGDGETVRCVVADADERNDGVEIVLLTRERRRDGSGEVGRVHVLRHAADDWRSELVGEVSATTEALAVGRVHPQGAGRDIVTFDSGVTLSQRGPEGWARVLQGSGFDGGARERAVAIDAAGHVARASDSLTIYRFAVEMIAFYDWPSGSFASFIIAQNRKAFGEDWLPPLRIEPRMKYVCGGQVGASQASLAVGGGGTLFGCDDGSLRLLTEGEERVLHRGHGVVHAVLFDDLDPTTAGLEIAATGDDGRITLLHEGDTPTARWRPLVLFEDDLPLRDLQQGECTSSSRGPEIVAVGDSGRVLLSVRVR